MKNNQRTSGQEESKIIWTEVKGKIRLQISRPSYETWFTDTTVCLDDDLLIIYFANEFAREWVRMSL
ncbi:hypothetical protein ADK17_14545 [Bacillus anthracis]|nr:hypothetical protein ADK17_14545 [Bacillus anthracis]